MMPDAQMAVLVVVCFVSLELIRLVVRHAFKRFTSNDYVTHDDCKDCSEKKDDAQAGVKAEVRAVKKLLFVVALKVGVDEEEVKTLVE